MKLHLAVVVLKQLQLHGHAGLDAGQRDFGGLPLDTQRAEVVEAPPLAVERRQVQDWVVVIRDGHLRAGK